MVVNGVFFFMTIIVLMNLLIAMMTTSYEDVRAAAVGEWRLAFAGLVKEYTLAPNWPPPTSTVVFLFKTATKMLMRPKAKDQTKKKYGWGSFLRPTERNKVQLQLDIAARNSEDGEEKKKED